MYEYNMCMSRNVTLPKPLNEYAAEYMNHCSYFELLTGRFSQK